MTIKEKYEKMKWSLRDTNESWGWGQDYVYNIDIHSTRGKNEIIKIFCSDSKLIQLDYKLGVIGETEYNKKMKIMADCSRSINKIEVW